MLTDDDDEAEVQAVWLTHEPNGLLLASV